MSEEKPKYPTMKVLPGNGPPTTIADLHIKENMVMGIFVGLSNAGNIAPATLSAGTTMMQTPNADGLQALCSSEGIAFSSTPLPDPTPITESAILLGAVASQFLNFYASIRKWDLASAANFFATDYSGGHFKKNAWDWAEDVSLVAVATGLALAGGEGLIPEVLSPILLTGSALADTVLLIHREQNGEESLPQLILDLTIIATAGTADALELAELPELIKEGKITAEILEGIEEVVVAAENAAETGSQVTTAGKIADGTGLTKGLAEKLNLSQTQVTALINAYAATHQKVTEALKNTEIPVPAGQHPLPTVTPKPGQDTDDTRFTNWMKAHPEAFPGEFKNIQSSSDELMKWLASHSSDNLPPDLRAYLVHSLTGF